MYLYITLLIVSVFRHHCLSHNSKVDQDRFLLKYMDISIPTHRKKKECENRKPKSVVVKYKFRRQSGEAVPVCAKLFMNITGKNFFLCTYNYK